MCGRFAVGAPDPAVWADWLGLADPGEGWPEPSWNVAPTQEAAIVVAGEAGRTLRRARWGLVPRWWRKPLSELRASTFNARSEDAHAKPMFRDAWKHARCLVPALGYYEWTGRPGQKRAFFVTLAGNAPGLCLAGLWAVARPEGEAQPLVSFTVLTTGAGEATRHLHPRTPVILPEEAWADWLAGGDGRGLMVAPPDERVLVREVDPRVGRVAENGPELIEGVGLGL